MPRFSLVVFSLLAVTTSARCESPPSPPTWHAVDGRVLDIGAPAKVTSDSIQIQKPDSSTTELKLESLSIADRAFALTNKNKASEFQKPIRQWTSAGGTYHFDAKAVSVDDKIARLVKSDGNVANVPLDKLSKDDRSYLERLKRAGTRPENNPFTGSEDTFGTAESFLGKPATTTQPQARTTAKVPISGSGGRSKSPTNRAGAPSLPDSEDADRNPNGEMVTGHTETGIPTYTGPRGGVYHYSKSGNKVYSKKK